MANIPAVLEKTDFEALSEDVQGYFTEKDGKFYPNFSQTDIEKLAVGLRQNRDTILEEKRELEQEVKTYKALGSPDDIQAKLDEAKSGQPKQVQEIEDKYKAELASLKENATKQINEAKTGFETREQSLMGTIRKSVLGAEVSKAIAEADGNPKLLTPVVERSLRLNEVKTEDGSVDFVTEVLDAEGKPRYADHLGTRLSVTDLVLELQKDPDYKPAFKANGGGGGGGSNNQTATLPRGKTITRSEFDKRSAEGDTTLRTFLADGGKIVDD